MKRLVALVAVVAMLFMLVPTAGAFAVPMYGYINPLMLQYGPDASKDVQGITPAEDFMVEYFPYNAFTSEQTMVITGDYGDLKQWYNYTNNSSQEAWFRFQVAFSAWDNGSGINVLQNFLDTAGLYMNGTTYVNSFMRDKLQLGTPVYINGVYTPLAVLRGGPTYNGPALDFNLNTGTDLDTLRWDTALGLMLNFRAVKGGNTETYTIVYNPNTPEEYTYKLTVKFVDTKSNGQKSAAFIDTGANAPYYNGRVDGDLIMDVVSKGEVDDLIRSNVDYKLKLANGGAPAIVNASKYALNTIQLEGSLTLYDANKNPLPARTTVIGNVEGNAKKWNDIVSANTHYFEMKNFIANQLADGSIVNLFLPNDVYSSIFDFATRTDDDVYGELNSNGQLDVCVNIVDNGNSLVKEKLALLIEEAAGNPFVTFDNYFVLLNQQDFLVNGQLITIYGVKNRVNYEYSTKIHQRVYTRDMLNWQTNDFNIKINAVDRIETPTFEITGNSNSVLAIGATRQLQGVMGHGSVVTDKDIIWTSDNTAVATVSDSGLVTGKAAGVAHITAHFAKNSDWKTVTVTVGDPVVAPVAPTTTPYFVMVGSKSSLNVRSGPGTSYARVGTLKRGNQVNVYEIAGDWAKIDYNGSVAYVSARYISQ